MNEIEIDLDYLHNKFIKSINKKAPACNTCHVKSILKKFIAEKNCAPAYNEQIYDDKHIGFLIFECKLCKKEIKMKCLKSPK